MPLLCWSFGEERGSLRAESSMGQQQRVADVADPRGIAESQGSARDSWLFLCILATAYAVGEGQKNALAVCSWSRSSWMSWWGG